MVEFLDELAAIVGRSHVLTRDRDTRPFRKGFRYGTGRVRAVVRPGSLVEQWRVLRACVAAGRIVIFQAANTGLTGGSTPWGDYDREVVVVSLRRLRRVHLLGGGRQVVCLPGASLDMLEKALRPLGREPHSVIGSSCIGASVLGGICNNSGGALIRRGPAFTEMALYAQVTESGTVELVNHLGIALGNDPEEILATLEAGGFNDADVAWDTGRAASDQDYGAHVRDVDAGTPARFNADPRRLKEASGCAGKLAVFAVRLDTFEAETTTRVFYVGSNDTAELTAIRRHMLSRFASLPIAGEYIHRDAYDVAAAYGKDTFLTIRRLGTDRMPQIFATKARLDAMAERLGVTPGLSDRLAQRASRWFPQHLPERMNAWRDRYEHHLLIRMGADGIEEARAYLGSIFPSASGDVFECTPRKARRRSCTVSRWRERRCAIARSIATRWRTSSRSTSRSAATTRTGSSACRRRSRGRSSASSTMGISSAMCSIRTTWSGKASIASRSSTPCGGFSTRGARNTPPSTTSATSTRPSRRSRSSIGRSIRRTR